jgi:hypothetical protein
MKIHFIKHYNPYDDNKLQISIVNILYDKELKCAFIALSADLFISEEAICFNLNLLVISISFWYRYKTHVE